MFTIIAIGGEKIGPLQNKENVKKVIIENIRQVIIKKPNKKSLKTLFISTAKNDSEEYIAAMKIALPKLKAVSDNIPNEKRHS